MGTFALRAAHRIRSYRRVTGNQHRPGSQVAGTVARAVSVGSVVAGGLDGGAVPVGKAVAVT